MTSFAPFSVDGQSLSIGDLTAENYVDRVALYGSLQISKDQEGLGRARELKSLVDAIVIALETESLPAKVLQVPIDEVKNPFV